MKTFSLADKLIIGFIVLLGMAEAGHLFMVFGHRPFSDAARLYGVGVGILAAGVAGYEIWRRVSAGDAHFSSAGQGRGVRNGRRKQHVVITPVLVGACLVFGLLALYQFMTIVSLNDIDRTGDMTVETVESILDTGSAYEVNPLTGRAYTAGVPNRIRILGLPTFYAIICRTADLCTGPATDSAAQNVLEAQGVAGEDNRSDDGWSHWELLTKWIPAIVLFLSYLAFWTVAKALFPEKKDREKRMIFMAFIAVALCVGDYAFGMEGFGLLHGGYRGVTIRGAVLVPYTFGLTLRHKWKTTAVCVLAEGCIVWTLYGMGVCLAVILGMGAIRLWQIRRGENLHIAGKEA